MLTLSFRYFAKFTEKKLYSHTKIGEMEKSIGRTSRTTYEYKQSMLPEFKLPAKNSILKHIDLNKLIRSPAKKVDLRFIFHVFFRFTSYIMEINELFMLTFTEFLQKIMDKIMEVKDNAKRFVSELLKFSSCKSFLLFKQYQKMNLIV